MTHGYVGKSSLTAVPGVHPTHQDAGNAVGKRTLVEQLPVQRMLRTGGAPSAGVQAAAAHGTSGRGGKLPHLDIIQTLFGHHDVSHVQAHTDGAAREGAAAMGAEAFASGDHVAFAGAPDLHTAAHEAAHVVQQRAGVQLKGGVGEVGDAYERQADAVADCVVQGRSAEHLLGDTTSAPAGAAVQRKMTFTNLGSDYAYIMGTLVRHAFSTHSKVIRKLHPSGSAILEAIAAPVDMPNAIEEMMKAPKDFGEYDLDSVDDLGRLFVLFAEKLPWQQYRGKTIGETLRAGAKGERHEGEKREQLTDTEENQRGYALLPMLSHWAEHDKVNEGRLKHMEGSDRDAVTFHLQGGKLRAALDDKVLTTTSNQKMTYPDMYRAMTDVAESEGKDINKLSGSEFEQMQKKAFELGPTFIFVMNAQGAIFAAKELNDVLHHSSFLAGGAVAGAGTIRTTGDGTINFISNKSGHYKPAPAYLWQVLFNMVHHGVDLAGVKIWVLGMEKQFASAKHFFTAFDPSKDPRFFDNDWAVKQLDQIAGG